MVVVQPDQNINNQPVISGQPMPSPDYSFITNPQQNKRSLFSFGGASKTSRLISVSVGLLILVVVFVIIKNIVTVNPINKADYLDVINQQQIMLHILTVDLSNGGQMDLSPTNQNFAITAQLSLATSQAALLNYLRANHQGVNAIDLQKKINNPAVDNEITAAVSTNGFNQLFSSVMQTQLTLYAQKLSIAYKASTGPKGRALLKQDYSGTQLLIKQLNSVTS